MILVTGGCGFIGANFIVNWLASHDEGIVNLDALTYAANQNNLSALRGDDRYQFIHGDITDTVLLDDILLKYRPRAIIHFAAESHVDRSISDPGAFIRTNIQGTFSLLSAARQYWDTLQSGQKSNFRFLHVSTDEVYGSLTMDEPAFTESHPYQPNSPYSASKAGSDHLVRAWFHTYGFPALTTHCSNNYGPFQLPEKLIPCVIRSALLNQPITVYGDGKNVRDWLYVTDHCHAIEAILARGRVGDTYNIGGCNELSNLEVIKTICGLLNELSPDPDGPYERLITFVTDRPGHDRRYAINAEKIEHECGWLPRETFASGIRKTVSYYLANEAWLTGDLEQA